MRENAGAANWSIWALVASATILLSGCSGSAADESALDAGPTLPSTTAPKSSTTPTTPAGPSTNARGNIVKQLGQEGGFLSSDGSKAVIKFTVDSIGPAKCAADYDPAYGAPENGHLIQLALRLSTAPELASDPDLSTFTINPNDFQYIGADGVTVTNIATIGAYTCQDQRTAFPSDPLSPASQYRGQVTLDLPAPHGVLVYRPTFMANGWEWQF